DVVKLWDVNVATEGQAARGGLKASPGFRVAENIAPSVRRPGIGVDIEAFIFFDAKRQSGQELPLRAIKTRARPFKGDLGARVHSLRDADCSIVIPQDRHGPAFNISLDSVDRPTGVCTVPNIVPEKHITIRAGAFGVRQAGRKGLAVGVNVA